MTAWDPVVAWRANEETRDQAVPRPRGATANSPTSSRRRNPTRPRLRPLPGSPVEGSRSGQRFAREDWHVQLGMIGLGRMGANMVRRLVRAGHQCVVYDMSA